MQVLDDGVEVELLELFAVVEFLAHRVGPGRVAVEDAEIELVRPPVRVRPGAGDGLAAASAREGAFCFVGHGVLSWDPRMGSPHSGPLGSIGEVLFSNGCHSDWLSKDPCGHCGGLTA